jgi:hypothetical protein
METNYEVVTFSNIDTDDFKGMWGGKEYLVKGKEVKMFPAFLANHFAKQLAVKVCIKTGKSWDNESPELAAIIGRVLSPIAQANPSVATPVAEVVKEPEFPEIEQEEVFTCETCGKTAASKAGLSAHMRSHK